MLFETESEALAWIQSKPRILTKEYLAAIPWGDVKKHELGPALVPVLRYMRDIEVGTLMYFDELRRTPTWNEKPVREFMERWVSEEPLHGELLERFLGEAGYPDSDKWFANMKAALPKSYYVMEDLEVLLAKVFGKHFAGVHMTFGAVNELSAMTGYQRLWTEAKHPVLEYILRGVAREEAMHYFFYWSVARMKLLRSGFDQKLNRFMVGKFWKPVGEGLRGQQLSNMVIQTLFGEEAPKIFDHQVNSRMEDLPGLRGLKAVTERMQDALEGKSSVATI